MYRIPPINCLATFEVLARVRSMKKAAEELCVTPSAISHRMRLMESILQRPLFDDVDSIGNFPLVTGGLPEQFFQAFDALA